MNLKNVYSMFLVALLAVAGEGVLFCSTNQVGAEENLVAHTKPSMPSKTELLTAIMRDIGCAAGWGGILGGVCGGISDFSSGHPLYMYFSVAEHCMKGVAIGAMFAFIASPIVRGYLHVCQGCNANS